MDEQSSDEMPWCHFFKGKICSKLFLSQADFLYTVKLQKLPVVSPPSLIKSKYL
jgi:hypothetical protein